MSYASMSRAQGLGTSALTMHPTMYQAQRTPPSFTNANVIASINGSNPELRPIGLHNTYGSNQRATLSSLNTALPDCLPLRCDPQHSPGHHAPRALPASEAHHYQMPLPVVPTKASPRLAYDEQMTRSLSVSPKNKDMMSIPAICTPPEQHKTTAADRLSNSSPDSGDSDFIRQFIWTDSNSPKELQQLRLAPMLSFVDVQVGCSPSDPSANANTGHVNTSHATTSDAHTGHANSSNVAPGVTTAKTLSAEVAETTDAADSLMNLLRNGSKDGPSPEMAAAQSYSFGSGRQQSFSFDPHWRKLSYGGPVRSETTSQYATYVPSYGPYSNANTTTHSGLQQAPIHWAVRSSATASVTNPLKRSAPVDNPAMAVHGESHQPSLQRIRTNDNAAVPATRAPNAVVKQCALCKGVCIEGMNYRAVISQFFGRNKNVTKLIPARFWPLSCRKGYQRAKYHADNNGQKWYIVQEGYVRDMVHTLENWWIRDMQQQPLTWTIQMLKGVHEKPEKNVCMPAINRQLKSRGLLGKNKSTQDVLDVLTLLKTNIIPWARENVDAPEGKGMDGARWKKFPSLGDIEFLPQAMEDTKKALGLTWEAGTAILGE